MSATGSTDNDYIITKIGAKIPRLNHSNYPAWANAMRYALIGAGAWGIVNGTEYEPDVPSGGAKLRDCNKFKDYNKRFNKAVSFIYGAVTPEIQGYISSITDPEEMWTTLQEIMDIAQDEAGSAYLSDKFHREVFKPNDTIDSYISRVLGYQARLVETKHKLTDEDVITKLLTALPPTYNAVKEVMFHQPDRTVSSVIAALRRYAETSLTPSPSILLSTTRNNPWC